MSVLPLRSLPDLLPTTGRWAELPGAVAWCRRLAAEQGCVPLTADWWDAVRAGRAHLESLSDEARAVLLREARA